MMNEEFEFLDEFPKDNEGNYIVYELFTFDNLFRLFLKSGLTHQEVMERLITTCSFSALVFQDRIFNEKYMHLKAEDSLSPEEASRKAKVISDLLQIVNSSE